MDAVSALIDTSAWVEYLRGTRSRTTSTVRDLLAAETEPCTTDVVVMEVLAGGRDESHAAQLRSLLARCHHLSVTLDDFEEAAALYRRLRRMGVTVRALNDCLVAVAAIRYGVPVLHADRDFDAIAGHSNLEVVA